VSAISPEAPTNSVGKATNPRLRSTSGVLNVTSPASPNSDLAVMSFNGDSLGWNAMPKMPEAVISSLPPLPWKAFALMSLPLGPVGGSAIRKSASILMFPPLAVSMASADICSHCPHPPFQRCLE
jgi:hypothetical protein